MQNIIKHRFFLRSWLVVSSFLVHFISIRPTFSSRCGAFRRYSHACSKQCQKDSSNRMFVSCLMNWMTVTLYHRLFQFVFIVLSADSCIETPINLGSNPDAIMSFLQDPEKQLLRWQDSSDNPSTPAVKKHKATLSRRLSLESDETVESSPSREASSDFLCKSNTTVTFL
jgi:hypothetical protein